MPAGKLLGYVVIYRSENRVYPDTNYGREGGTNIVELLTLPQAETLAKECREAWADYDPEQTQIAAVYAESLPDKD